MKALSLWQPWATLLVSGWKQVETRSWGTTERGLVAIHATASLPAVGRAALDLPTFQNALFHCLPRVDVMPDDLITGLPHGAIIGIGRLGGCREMTEERIACRLEHEPMEHAFGIYEPGRYEWHFERTWIFAEPIPCKGFQKLWTVRDDAADQLADRLQRGGMSEPEAAQLALSQLPSTTPIDQEAAAK